MKRDEKFSPWFDPRLPESEKDSSALVAVVPTAMTLPPLRFVSLDLSGLFPREISVHSASIEWSSTCSVFTGRKVPGPMWSVIEAMPTPSLSRDWSIFSVKWRPAVGAAIEPSFSAKTV